MPFTRRISKRLKPLSSGGSARDGLLALNKAGEMHKEKVKYFNASTRKVEECEVDTFSTKVHMLNWGIVQR